MFYLVMISVIVFVIFFCNFFFDYWHHALLQFTTFAYPLGIFKLFLKSKCFFQNNFILNSILDITSTIVRFPAPSSLDGSSRGVTILVFAFSFKKSTTGGVGISDLTTFTTSTPPSCFLFHEPGLKMSYKFYTQCL